MARIADAGGPTNTSPACHASLGKIAAFRQEAVARVNARGAGILGDFKQPFDVEIAVARFGGTDQVGLITYPAVQRVRVGGRIDRDRAYSEPFGRSRDPAGNFAAIGNEDRLEHDDRLAGARDRLQLTACVPRRSEGGLSCIGAAFAEAAAGCVPGAGGGGSGHIGSVVVAPELAGAPPFACLRE